MNPNPSVTSPAPRSGEAGFTLVEALVAMVVLVFGIIAVANLMIFAASANSVGNASTVATAMASRELERLKGLPFTHASLEAGGDLDGTDFPSAYSIEETVAGVGTVRTRWEIEEVGPVVPGPQGLFIRVRSEVIGPLVRGRSRADFTTFRSCTSATVGC